MRISRRRFLEVTGAGALATAAGCSAGSGRGADDLSSLLVRQQSPFNAEPELSNLVRSAITPLRHFYIRRHGPPPRIDAGAFELQVTGLVERPCRIRLGALRDGFAKGSVTATLQCAGNRRSEHSRLKKVGGVQWDAGAIGNAEWAGARLGDLLRQAEVKPAARHVSFHSLDECAIPGGTSAFGASIPLEKALAPETLLAYEMNGDALTVEHGFPVRTLVPGFIGARSVKWLGEIRVSDKPSDNFFQARDYKLFPPEVTAETAKWEEAEALTGMPTNSAIGSPAAGESVKAGLVRVRGYALAATGSSITKAEVSADGGRTWTGARLAPSNGPFSWNLWEAELALQAGEHLLAVRASDSTGSVQPETAAWNFKGYLCNAWHRVPVTVA